MIQSSGTLRNNTISENNVTSGGGGLGVYKGSPVIDNNTIISNTSTNLGGGVYLFSTNAILTKNKVTGNTAATLAGGIDVASCSPSFNGNLITGNTADKGGGLYLWYSYSVFTNNVITDNKSKSQGSGLYIGGSQPRLLHTTIARNSGGGGIGVYVTSDGMTEYSTVAMTNTLLISHTVGIKITVSNTLTLNGVLWYSTPTTISQVSAIVSVQNQYTGNPSFNTDGYHIKSTSAAINKGVPAGIYTDIDGQPRTSTTSDLGADEYWPSGTPKYIYLPIIIR